MQNWKKTTPILLIHRSDTIILVPKQSSQPVQPDPNNPNAPAQPAAPTNEQLMASLPLALDPVLSTSQPPAQTKRTLGDNFDERLKLNSSNFATTIDNKAIFACGFWDNSFRVFHSESGMCYKYMFLCSIQAVYLWHLYVITCRSDTSSSIRTLWHCHMHMQIWS